MAMRYPHLSHHDSARRVDLHLDERTARCGARTPTTRLTDTFTVHTIDGHRTGGSITITTRQRRLPRRFDAPWSRGRSRIRFRRKRRRVLQHDSICAGVIEVKIIDRRKPPTSRQRGPLKCMLLTDSIKRGHTIFRPRKAIRININTVTVPHPGADLS